VISEYRIRWRISESVPDNAAIIGREAAIDPSAGGNPIPVDAAQLGTYLPGRGGRKALGSERRRVKGPRILIVDGNVCRDSRAPSRSSRI